MEWFPGPASRFLCLSCGSCHVRRHGQPAVMKSVVSGYKFGASCTYMYILRNVSTGLIICHVTVIIYICIKSYACRCSWCVCGAWSNCRLVCCSTISYTGFYCGVFPQKTSLAGCLPIPLLKRPLLHCCDARQRGHPRNNLAENASLIRVVNLLGLFVRYLRFDVILTINVVNHTVWQWRSMCIWQLSKHVCVLLKIWSNSSFVSLQLLWLAWLLERNRGQNWKNKNCNYMTWIVHRSSTVETGPKQKL